MKGFLIGLVGACCGTVLGVFALALMVGPVERIEPGECVCYPESAEQSGWVAPETLLEIDSEPTMLGVPSHGTR